MEKRLDGRWWDETWNPITGCTPASEGCRNCYAARMAPRLAGRFGYPEKPHQFDVTFHPDKLGEPLRRKKPTVYFVCSMGDLFHEDVTDEQLAAVFNMMQTCNNHVFLVPTKRPERMREFWKLWFDAYEELFRLSAHVALPNVWPGVSVENQDTMWRIEELVKIPAAHHWVNFGPLLGPIDTDQLRHYLEGCPEGSGGGTHYVTCDMALDACAPEMEGLAIEEPPQWAQTAPPIGGVAVEGESGPGARPMHPDWARGIRDQCAEAGVPFTFKQWGEWLPGSEVQPAIARKFRDMPPGFDELAVERVRWDQRRHEWPEGSRSYWFGKQRAGRELDGQVHDAWPWDVIGEGDGEEA